MKPLRNSASQNYNTMKKLTKLLLAICLFCFQLTFSNTPITNDDEINELLKELSVELNYSHNYYNNKRNVIYQEISQVKFDLIKFKKLRKQVSLLIKKEQLKDQLTKINASENADINKIRYLKGLSIIKILYEKVLSLDHHFSSIATFNEISKIGNPNSYQEFTQIKDLIKSKTDKKKAFKLTSILGNNVYASVVDTFVGLFNSNANSKEKEVELKKVECILDFTLRMNNDLNNIYFETAFLQKSNDKIMLDLERLFVDYTKPIKYLTPLKQCRDNDDWDVVREKLTSFLDNLNTAITEQKNNKVLRMQINLNFPIDRLLQFITQYNNFIDQGGKFYEKFKIILNSYENEQQCSSSLPPAYKKLKEDIDIAINKFNTAYKPVEINGSKMKEVLYGINEYD